MKIKGQAFENLRKINVPLTDRILKAHTEDLSEWAEKAPAETKQKYLERIDRLITLRKKIATPKSKGSKKKPEINAEQG